MKFFLILCLLCVQFSCNAMSEAHLQDCNSDSEEWAVDNYCAQCQRTAHCYERDMVTHREKVHGECRYCHIGFSPLQDLLAHQNNPSNCATIQRANETKALKQQIIALKID